MKRIKSLYELAIYPLKVLYIAFVIMGIGNIILSDNFAIFYTITNTYILLIAKFLTLAGIFLIKIFPLILILGLINRKNLKGQALIISLVGYISFLISTMVFSDTNLNLSYYITDMGISYTTFDALTNVQTYHYPLQTGLFGSLIVLFCSQLAYLKSRGRTNYGFFAFLKKDDYGVILNILFCFISGFFVSLLFPYFADLTTYLVSFISLDITNPINLFVYGILDRFSAVIYVPESIKQSFWFGSNGGTMATITGARITGDIALFEQTVEQAIINSKAGRFISPYFVLNIFAIPGYIIALQTIQTDRLQRTRTIFFATFAIIVSIMTASLLPVELFMLFLSPLILGFHILYTGLLFAICEFLNIHMGYIYYGDIVSSSPGSFIDIVIYFRNHLFSQSINYIIIIGFISMLIYFLVTRIYFKYLAFDILNTGRKKKVVEGLLIAIGGIDNIKSTSSSISRLIVQVEDPTKLNLSHLQRLGATKVMRTRAGLAMSFGASSLMIKMLVDGKINENKREIK